MKTETSNSNVVNAVLLNEWQLQCTYSDLNFMITAYQLNAATKLVQIYESLPQKLEILADSFADLAQLLTTSKGITVQENCLVIQCKIGEKLKTLKIEMKQEKIPQQQQILNLLKLLESEKKQRLQEKTVFEKTISQINSKYKTEKQNNNKFQKEYKDLSKRYQQNRQLIQKLNVQERTCSKYGCNNQIVFACETLHRPPIQKGNNRYICSSKCEY